MLQYKHAHPARAALQEHVRMLMIVQAATFSTAGANGGGHAL